MNEILNNKRQKICLRKDGESYGLLRGGGGFLKQEVSQTRIGKWGITFTSKCFGDFSYFFENHPPPQAVINDRSLIIQNRT